MKLISDIKYALRLLRNTPLFTTITIVTVGLSISLYLASHVTERVLTDEPLPFPNGDRFVTIKTGYAIFGIESAQNNHNDFSYNYLKQINSSFSGLHAYERGEVVLSDGEYARTYSSAAIEIDLLSATGVVPVMGRLFSENDAAATDGETLLINEDVWRDYYNADADIIGRTSRVNGNPATIIGVLPASFRFPVYQDVWTPLSIPETSTPTSSTPFTADTPLTLVGILNDKSSFESASDEVSALMEQLSVQYPDLYNNRLDFAVPYANFSLSTFNAGQVMSIISLIIVALAIVNLSSLLFIRSQSRQHELAVRASVGATGSDLAKQVMIESFIICFFGFLLSLILGSLFLQVLDSLFRLSALELPFWLQFNFTAETIGIGAGYAIAIWVLSGIATAVRALVSQPHLVQNTNVKSGSKHGRSVFTKIVVTTEVVLSFFLLICCGAIIYLANLATDADFGVNTEAYLISTISLNNPDYELPNTRLEFLRSLTEQAKEISGVYDAAVSTAPPGMAGQSFLYELEDRDVSLNGQLPSLRSIWVSEDYFQNLGVNTLSGREFDGSDSADSESTVVVPLEFAELLWPEESAIGRRIGISSNGEIEWLVVVGVVPNLMQSAMNMAGGLPPSIYRPLNQSTPFEFQLITRVDPRITVADFQRDLQIASAQIDRNIAIDNVRPLQQQILADQSGTGMISQIFAFFSFLTFAFAGIGIYGVIARSIATQTNEIGVRRAIGSTNFKIVTDFLKQGAIYLFLGGILGGGAGILTSTATLATITDAVSPSQFLPGVLLVVVVLMSTLVFVASYFPSRKAVALEPGDALRYE